jgi:hypothetical protein
MTSEIDNALTRYYDDVRRAVQITGESKDNERGLFAPKWELPELTDSLAAYFSASALSGGSMGEYRGRKLNFLNLTGNPRTCTTKTFGSQVIVARALKHIEATGEGLILVTPSSANKAVALRDAVLRSYEVGLATPSMLRVAAIVPFSSRIKLWNSPMSTDLALRAANPLSVFRGPEREDVKKVTTDAYAAVAEEIRTATGFRLWYTLDPDNYKVADVVRASFEDEFLNAGGRERWHSHAVSSAYGFLGHNLGAKVLGRVQMGGQLTKYLLVQHLETPHLVQAVTGRDLPEYVLDKATGLYRQVGQLDPHFPEVCYSATECLERTFWTRRPPTTAAVQELLRKQGGDGIVVSLPECLQRYQEVRRFVANAGMTRLPEDPRKLREFAMVMAVTGVLTAIDRGLLPEWADVLVHGSGAYSEEEFDPPDRGLLYEVASSEDVAHVLWNASKA